MQTAVILAGGQSRRMGEDKLTLRFGARSLLDSAVRRFSQSFDTVYLSVADPDKYQDIRAERLVDIHPGCGPISGIHAALTGTRDAGVFVAAADLPFAQPAAAHRLIELCADADVCLTTDERGRPEPLFAYYKKSILPHVESAIRAGDYKLVTLIDRLNARRVSPDELGDLWDERLLLNVNYPDDYKRLVRMEVPDEDGDLTK